MRSMILKLMVAATLVACGPETENDSVGDPDVRVCPDATATAVVVGEQFTLLGGTLLPGVPIAANVNSVDNICNELHEGLYFATSALEDGFVQFYQNGDITQEPIEYDFGPGVTRFKVMGEGLEPEPVD